MVVIGDMKPSEAQDQQKGSKEGSLLERLLWQGGAAALSTAGLFRSHIN